MTDTVLAAIVGGIAGIVTGSISSLIAPWANWGIEKRKQKLEQRKSLIIQWRRLIKALNDDKPAIFDDDRSPVLGDVLLTHDYASLKPHLTSHSASVIQIWWDGFYYGQNGREVIDLLTDEVSRIEKEWKLV